MSSAGFLSASLLDLLYDFIDVGVSTNQIDEFCFNFAKKHNAIPAPLNYKGFPKSICTSVNDVICHGIPSEYILQEGDIVNVDVTLIFDGYYGDTSRMYVVGDYQDKTKYLRQKKLCRVTYECLEKAINIVKDGVRLSDIGSIIQSHAEKNGFSVVRDFCGHGIGKVFHQKPSVLHYVPKGFRNSSRDIILKEGDTITIEPMINEGRWESYVDKNDGWTAKTIDRMLSAQFEHTIGIEKDGCQIFTLSPSGKYYPKEIML